jgi:hypothetical protein
VEVGSWNAEGGMGKEESKAQMVERMACLVGGNLDYLTSDKTRHSPSNREIQISFALCYWTPKLTDSKT